MAVRSALVAEHNRTTGTDFSTGFGAQGRRASDCRREVNPVLQLYTFGQTQILGRLRREEGQTMAEYAVVLGVVTLLVIGAITLLGTNIMTALNRVAGYIK